ATATTIAAVLLVGIVISTWQAIRATNAENLAGQRLAGEKQATTKANAASTEAKWQKTQAEISAQDAKVQKDVAEQNFGKARKAVDDYFIKVSDSQLLKAPGMQ